MTYTLLRPLLFALDAETAHGLTLGALSALNALGLIRDRTHAAAILCPREVMGIRFANPVGLAAGLDKNGDHINALATLGFGFIEIGTVTPRPQPGNPRPRLYRLPAISAVINRMGFNNKGVDHLIARVREANYSGVLGINIGKNFDTPLVRAAEDYVGCLCKVYPYASYVTVNISSPNTANLRELQSPDELAVLLAALKAEQTRLAEVHGKYVPLAVKIAPDLTVDQTIAIATRLIAHKIDAVIATNTTTARSQIAHLAHLAHLAHGNETGGLSGAPLTTAARAVVSTLKRALDGALPIIGVGGIMNAGDAAAMMAAGASLVQLYTGLIYRGPALVAQVATQLCRDA